MLRVFIALLLISSPVVALQPEKLWSRNLGEEITALAMGNNTIVTGTKSGKISIFSLSGKKLASAKLDSPIWSLDISDGLIYAGGDYYLFCLNKSLDVLWKTDLYDRVNDLDIEGDYIAAVTSSRMGFLIKNSSKRSWRKSLDSSAWATAIGKDEVYFATAKGSVYAFSLSGEEKWRYYHREFISDLAFGNGTLLVASRNLVFIKSGVSVKRFYAKGEFESACYSDRGYFLASTPYEVFALSSKGKRLWSYDSGGRLACYSKNFALAKGSTLYLFEEPDLEPPKISLISPLNNSEVSGIVKIDFRVSEPSDVKVLIDGNYACSQPCEWDTSASKEGEHTIEVVAVDRQGNRASAKIVVYKKKSLPEVELPKISKPNINITTKENISKKLGKKLEDIKRVEEIAKVEEIKVKEGFGLKAVFLAFIAGLVIPVVVWIWLMRR